MFKCRRPISQFYGSLSISTQSPEICKKKNRLSKYFIIWWSKNRRFLNLHFMVYISYEKLFRAINIQVLSGRGFSLLGCRGFLKSQVNLFTDFEYFLPMIYFSPQQNILLQFLFIALSFLLQKLNDILWERMKFVKIL